MLVLAIMIFCKKDGSEWVFKIEGKATTVKQLEDAYQGFFVMMKEQLQQSVGRLMSDEELQSLIDDPMKAGNPQMAEMFNELKKERFAERYSDMILFNLEAQRKGYLKRKDVKAKLEFMEKYFIANMYLLDQVKVEEIQVSEAEATKAWESIQRENPAYKTIPADRGIELAKSRILAVKARQKQAEIGKAIRDYYKIENNTDLKLAEVFKKRAEEKKAQDKSKETPKAESKTEPAPGTTTEVPKK